MILESVSTDLVSKPHEPFDDGCEMMLSTDSVCINLKSRGYSVELVHARTLSSCSDVDVELVSRLKVGVVMDARWCGVWPVVFVARSDSPRKSPSGAELYSTVLFFLIRKHTERCCFES